MKYKGCLFCDNYNGNMTCKAYPAGIPWPILSGDVKHNEKRFDDNGIQFEPIKDANKSNA